MLLTLLPALLGFSVGKGKHRSYRRWKILGITLGMAFFLSLIINFIPQIKTMILPVGTVELYEYLFPQYPQGPFIDPIAPFLWLPLISISLTFFWFLVGMFIKWMASKRGL